MFFFLQMYVSLVLWIDFKISVHDDLRAFSITFNSEAKYMVWIEFQEEYYKFEHSENVINWCRLGGGKNALIFQFSSNVEHNIFTRKLKHFKEVL